VIEPAPITTFRQTACSAWRRGKSTQWPFTAVEGDRPSCGSRFSAMSMPAMILGADQTLVHPLGTTSFLEQAVER